MQLFERSNIGSMQLKNRVGMAPMGTNGLTDIDCGYSRRLIEFYEARARGGCSMILTGSAVTNTEIEGGIAHFLPRLTTPAYMGRLSELCDAVHHHGSKLVLQLTVGFGRVNFIEANPIPPVSASEGPCFLDPSVNTRALTQEEIQQLVISFATSAGMGQVCGVDAIEISGYGGYLLDQFQSSLWNRRDDEYGGDLDGRMRFSMELIGATRHAVGDLPIIFKFSPDHYIEGGRTLDEGLEIARRLEAAGVDALHVDGGCYEVWNRVVPSMYEEPGCQLELSEAVKEVVSLPVIANGKLGDPELAKRVIEQGRADYIVLGRPLLADPDWVAKTKAGRHDEIRPCIGCNEACLGRGYEMKYLSCTVNPLTGMEKTYALAPVENPRSVLVVGGGPGGLEAARVAASRGCEVTLWEQGDRLGGKMNTAAVPPFKKDIRPLIDFMARQVEAEGVKVEFGRRATAAAVREFGPDVVIIATGSVLALPPIPGLEEGHVVSSVDVLDGNAEVGEQVVLVGGGLCGCEAAVHLAQQGKKVTVVEMLEDVAVGTNINTAMGIKALIAESGVALRCSARIVEITRDGVVLESGGSRQELAADSVVIATGFAADTTLRDDLESFVPEVVSVGDCDRPANILGAVWGGFHAARVL